MRTTAGWYRTESLPPPIDLPFEALAEVVTIRRGELGLLAARPGEGKSTFALNLARYLPSLYFAQEDPLQAWSLMAGLMLGEKPEGVRDWAQEDAIGLDEELASRGCQDVAILEGRRTINEIRLGIQAYEELFGYSPDVVVIDNLKDLTVPGHSYSTPDFYSITLPALKVIALELQCFILVLHHAKRGQDEPSLEGMIFGGDREASHVWWTEKVGDDRMRVTILKQREGPAPRSRLLEWFRDEGRIVG